MRLYLEHYRNVIHPAGRRFARREWFAIIVCATLVVANLALAALDGFHALDLFQYAAACVAALAVRLWIVLAFHRRRYFRLLRHAAHEAERRLAL